MVYVVPAEWRQLTLYLKALHLSIEWILLAYPQPDPQGSIYALFDRNICPRAHLVELFLLSIISKSTRLPGPSRYQKCSWAAYCNRRWNCLSFLVLCRALSFMADRFGTNQYFYILARRFTHRPSGLCWWC
mgnify:CR=1 FL=1